MLCKEEEQKEIERQKKAEEETDEEPEEDITDEILGDAEEPDDMDGYDYEDPEDEV